MSPHTDAGALLPCPFCGAPAAMSVLLDDDNEPDGDIISAWVACPCGIEMHESRTEKEAAMRWNCRQAASHGGAGGDRSEVQTTSALRAAEKELVDLARPISSVFNRSTKQYEFTDDHIKKALPGTFQVIEQIRAALAIPTAAQALKEPIAFIAARLTDLAEANALYGKDQRLGAPDKVARNGREISWLKDLRSLILTSSSVPSADRGTA